MKYCTSAGTQYLNCVLQGHFPDTPQFPHHGAIRTPSGEQQYRAVDELGTADDVFVPQHAAAESG